jgi:peptidoglycan biosynthesis protein MviN/MurJ (putative lipid II flippase)
VRGYYAMGNTKKPLTMNFLGEIITVILAFVGISLFNHVPGFSNFFSGLLRLEGLPNLSLLALPLAFSLGNIFNFFALWILFRKDFPESDVYPVLRTVIQTSVASVCMGIVTYGVLNISVAMIKQNTFKGIFLQGMVSGVIGASIFVAVLVMLRNEEIGEFIATLKRKFWKARVIVENSEIEG